MKLPLKKDQYEIYLEELRNQDSPISFCMKMSDYRIYLAENYAEKEEEYLDPQAIELIMNMEEFLNNWSNAELDFKTSLISQLDTALLDFSTSGIPSLEPNVIKRLSFLTMNLLYKRMSEIRTKNGLLLPGTSQKMKSLITSMSSTYAEADLATTADALTQEEYTMGLDRNSDILELATGNPEQPTTSKTRFGIWFRQEDGQSYTQHLELEEGEMLVELRVKKKKDSLWKNSTIFTYPVDRTTLNKMMEPLHQLVRRTKKRPLEATQNHSMKRWKNSY